MALASPSLRARRLPPPLLALPLLLAAGALRAQSLPPSCPASTPVDSPWHDRAASIVRHGGLPPSCLRALVRQCGREADREFLDGARAALCSVRYEALLAHGFGGDFQALVAWWRKPEPGVESD